MGYEAGDTITAAQYNIFVNNSSAPFGYNHFAGTGEDSIQEDMRTHSIATRSFDSFCKRSQLLAMCLVLAM